MRNASAIASLRAQIAQIEGQSRQEGGGLSLGALHDVAGGGSGTDDGAAALLSSACIAARTEGLVFWICPQPHLFAPSLAQAGLSPDRVIYVEAGDDKTVLACTEEPLRHGSLGAVVAEDPLSDAQQWQGTVVTANGFQQAGLIGLRNHALGRGRRGWARRQMDALTRQFAHGKGLKGGAGNIGHGFT